AFSPDGKALASVSGIPRSPDSPGELRLWDVSTGQTRGTPRGFAVTVTTVAFSPDGQTLVTGSGHWVQSETSAPGDAQLWDVRSGQPKATVPRPKVAVRYMRALV